MAARGLGSGYHGMNWIRGSTRMAIYFRDRNPVTGRMRCLWCNKTVWLFGQHGNRRACLDHLLPVSMGGTHHPRNLVTSCFECNRHRGACEYEAWIDSSNWDEEVDKRIRAGTERDLLPGERQEGRRRWHNRRVGEKHRGAKPPSEWRH